MERIPAFRNTKQKIDGSWSLPLAGLPTASLETGQIVFFRWKHYLSIILAE